MDERDENVVQAIAETLDRRSGYSRRYDWKAMAKRVYDAVIEAGMSPPDQATWRNAYNATVESARRAEAELRRCRAEVRRLRQGIQYLIESDPVRYKRLQVLLEESDDDG